MQADEHDRSAETASPADRREAGKRAAALRALDYVFDDIRLGLGTGTTAFVFVELLAGRVEAGLRVIGVPTSEATATQARRLGIPLATLDEVPNLDLTIDGADEFDPELRLIKGGGGALLREKIIASASQRMIVIADATKGVKTLGRFPLPIEVNRFGLEATRRAIVEAARQCGCEGEVALRQRDGQTFVTDGGHVILDGHFGRIPHPERLATSLAAVPGVVEHGLFLDIASAVISASADGAVTILGHPEA